MGRTIYFFLHCLFSFLSFNAPTARLLTIAFDYILIYNDTLLALKNITWDGVQQDRDHVDDFSSPTTIKRAWGTLAGSSVIRKTHTERELILCERDVERTYGAAICA
jgi:hypothetical protein